MNNETQPRRHNLLLPILILLVIAFALYTVIDTAITYRNISIWGVIACTLILLIAGYAFYRFFLVTYEYRVIGDTMVVRRRTPYQVSLVNAYQLNSIRSVAKARYGYSHHGHPVRRLNLCNSLQAALFTGMVMQYHEAGKNEEQVVVIEPPLDVQRLLKLNLEDRYHA